MIPPVLPLALLLASSLDARRAWPGHGVEGERRHPGWGRKTGRDAPLPRESRSRWRARGSVLGSGGALGDSGLRPGSFVPRKSGGVVRDVRRVGHHPCRAFFVIRSPISARVGCGGVLRRVDALRVFSGSGRASCAGALLLPARSVAPLPRSLSPRGERRRRVSLHGFSRSGRAARGRPPVARAAGMSGRRLFAGSRHGRGAACPTVISTNARRTR